jgi:hypothetical protein
MSTDMLPINSKSPMDMSPINSKSQVNLDFDSKVLPDKLVANLITGEFKVGEVDIQMKDVEVGIIATETNVAEVIEWLETLTVTTVIIVTPKGFSMDTLDHFIEVARSHNDNCNHS